MVFKCFSGDFLFLALLKHLLGIILMIFSRFLTQIQVNVSPKTFLLELVILIVVV